jgi:hypothetical protein
MKSYSFLEHLGLVVIMTLAFCRIKIIHIIDYARSKPTAHMMKKTLYTFSLE